MHTCAYGCRGIHIEDDLWEMVLYFHCVGSGGGVELRLSGLAVSVLTPKSSHLPLILVLMDLNSIRQAILSLIGAEPSFPGARTEPHEYRVGCILIYRGKLVAQVVTPPQSSLSGSLLAQG